MVAAARETGTTARVHLKVDSGLNRGGAALADWPDLVVAARKAEAEGAVRVVGLWSHFAYADAPGHSTIARQAEVFRDAVAHAESAGIEPEVRHLANSAATLTAPEQHFDLVRPGIAVYGLSPVPEVGGPSAYGLRPAMTLAANLVLVKRAPAGSGVCYGHTYTTDRETTLGLVPLGYADGVPRAGGNVGPVLAAGRTPHGRRPGLHGPVRARPRRRRGGGRATRSCCSGRATTAARPRRTGPTPPAPSPTRSSPGSARGCRGSTSTRGREVTA